ncbi:hypothetical protein BT93_B2643 [Corymbia citriodora subsp. variegata]|nr:hypothetical protein BT93_B2643 [Corymbia citriodora subsp. variegata]
MIPRPERLESIMKVIKKLIPCVAVVIEVESNHNSPAFTPCSLRCFSTIAHTLIVSKSVQSKMMRTEQFSNLCTWAKGLGPHWLAGEERNIRNVKFNVWRPFFSRFGMVEVDLGMASLYQANLMVKKFPCGVLAPLT